MDSRSRRFEAAWALHPAARPGLPDAGCDAPIRHTDHPQPTAADGETSGDNGQGLCEACNYAKEALGRSVTVVDTQPHTIEIRTPAGQVYRSQAPPLPGHVPRIDLAFSYGAA